MRRASTPATSAPTIAGLARAARLPGRRAACGRARGGREQGRRRADPAARVRDRALSARARRGYSAYPPDGTAAIAHLEWVRSNGADFLVFPRTSEWWLEAYLKLRAHLDRTCLVADREPDVGLVYDLRESVGGPADGWQRVTELLDAWEDHRGRPQRCWTGTPARTSPERSSAGACSPRRAGRRRLYLDRTVEPGRARRRRGAGRRGAPGRAAERAARAGGVARRRAQGRRSARAAQGVDRDPDVRRDLPARPVRARAARHARRRLRRRGDRRGRRWHARDRTGC